MDDSQNQGAAPMEPQVDGDAAPAAPEMQPMPEGMDAPAPMPADGDAA